MPAVGTWLLRQAGPRSGDVCGFVAHCSPFEPNGLHLGTSGALLSPQAQAESRSFGLQGGFRLSLTALEILEVGAAESGRLLHVYGRVRCNAVTAPTADGARALAAAAAFSSVTASALAE